MNKLIITCLLIAACASAAVLDGPAGNDAAPLLQEPQNEHGLYDLPDTQDIPVAARWCTSSFCGALCWNLGFPFSQCRSATVCHCWR